MKRDNLKALYPTLTPAELRSFFDKVNEVRAAPAGPDWKIVDFVRFQAWPGAFGVAVEGHDKPIRPFCALHAIERYMGDDAEMFGLERPRLLAVGPDGLPIPDVVGWVDLDWTA